MKKLLLALFILSSFSSKGTIHTIGVWGGYYQFVPASITIQLGDTLEWEPFAGLLPMMLHTITSDNIPVGAASFDQVWQMPADTFFQYIPQVAGKYEYVCTPHIPNGMIGEFTVVNGSATLTYVPDDSFETYLESNGLGNGISNDDNVYTSAIDTVTELHLSSLNINDLTGIEDFTSLTSLDCDDNNLTNLNISTNTSLFNLDCSSNNLTSLNVSGASVLNNLYCSNNNLISLDVSGATAVRSFSCRDNQLISLDIRNGNNINFYNFYTTGNPNLTCINVDDDSYSNANWTNIDSQHYFSTNCSGSTSIEEQVTNKELLKITDILGRETKDKRNTPLFYIFENGTVEKKIIID